jgi:hypothetical protein
MEKEIWINPRDGTYLTKGELGVELDDFEEGDLIGKYVLIKTFRVAVTKKKLVPVEEE